MLKIVPINIINEYWPQIRGGINLLLDKTKDEFKPEDIYMEIMLDRSCLYIAEDEDGLMGFVILTPYNKYGNSYLHIWIVVNYRNHDDLLFGIDEIKNIAMNLNIKYITYSSLRKGALKTCKEYGFEPTHQNYRYEV